MSTVLTNVPRYGLGIETEESIGYQLLPSGLPELQVRLLGVWMKVDVR